jgi:hypothetical protein
MAFAMLFCHFVPREAAAAQPPKPSFDPAKGFKPAQRDLTEIFLQIAGSLERYGSPEPYLRHVLKEEARIRELNRKERSASPRTFLPLYMTEDYLTRFSTNWNLLSPKIGLGPFAKNIGSLMNDAIHGTRGTGTMVVEIFNKHQTRVFDAMVGKGHDPADFEALKSELITRLELDKTFVDEEKYTLDQRDAVSYAIIIHGTTMKLFGSDQPPVDFRVIGVMFADAFNNDGACLPALRGRAFAEERTHRAWGAKGQMRGVPAHVHSLAQRAALRL